MKKIVLAFDSFKGSLSSLEVSSALEEGIREIFSEKEVEIVKIPLADGGEGTLDVLLEALGGELKEVETYDSLGRKIRAYFGWVPSQKLAIIELAQASGIELLKKEELRPQVASTYGTGILIKEALSLNPEKIILTIGGSATVDGGAGIAKALGYKLLDKKGKEIGEGNFALGQLVKIIPPSKDILEKLEKIDFLIATDVENPLCGKEGASYVYGPQKGVKEEDLPVFDENLKRLATVIKSDLGIDILNLKGSGAAGGVGGGSVAFLGGKLVKGFDLISQLLNLEEKFAGSDLIITGEGKLDLQTVFGKVPQGVLKLARKLKIPIIAIGGQVEEDAYQRLSEEFDAVFSIIPQIVPLEKALSKAQFYLKMTGKNLFSFKKL